MTWLASPGPAQTAIVLAVASGMLWMTGRLIRAGWIPFPRRRNH